MAEQTLHYRDAGSWIRLEENVHLVSIDAPDDTISPRDDVRTRGSGIEEIDFAKRISFAESGD